MAIDLLMKFVDGSTAIPAESLAEIDTTDDFTTDFTKGNFCELDDFDFGLNLVDTDSSSSKSSDDRDKEKEKEKKKSGRFSKWMQDQQAVSAQGANSKLYPVELEPFSFSRQVDKASPKLFQMCFQTKSFTSATLIKRKVFGARTALSESESLANFPFFRIDFYNVLLIGVDWSGSDVIKEKCKFICREVAVKYRPQLQDGTPGGAIGGDRMSLIKQQ